MTKILFYDVETTGLPIWSTPSSDPRQPHIVQMVAKLVDSETKDIHLVLDLIIKPDGWGIPGTVSDIHGITIERAITEGVSEKDAIALMFYASSIADVRVAHNESFDSRIMRIALKRYESDTIAEEWKSRTPAECTMRLATPICQIPKPTGRKGFKWPNLVEAYKHFTGNDMENAHNAMADVEACMSVYFAMQGGDSSE